MDTLTNLIERIESELREPSPTEVNFWREARTYKKKLAIAATSNNANDVASAAAAYGGFCKRWRRFLIKEISATVFVNSDVSRISARNWQQNTFGQSVASAELNVYANPKRSGAGRAANNLPSEDQKKRASKIYETYRDKIKDL